jgi:uroporphyrinogen-III synthase
VTRAQPGAGETARRLEGLGYSPVVAPLLEIRPVPQAPPNLRGTSGLVFTSRNGVDAFAALTREGRQLPVFAVGGATAQAARERGFGGVRSADGDLSDLAKLLASCADPQAVLLAPGAAEPAGDLAALLPDTVSLRRLVVYEAAGSGIGAPGAITATLLHSPRAGRLLAGLSSLTGGAVVAISDAAAAPLRGREDLEIHIADRPDEEALLAALGKAVAPV